MNGDILFKNQSTEMFINKNNQKEKREKNIYIYVCMCMSLYIAREI